MQEEDRTALRGLITGQRQAALGTVSDGTPFVSMVLYALEMREGAMPAPLIHVSRLSAHTRYLQVDPRASLLIMQPDVGEIDPQLLGRVSIQCLARVIHFDDPGYAAAKAAYAGRLPDQEYLFAFADFTLFRLEPQEARYVRGFGRAFTLDLHKLSEVLA
ncbi:MAG: pyridoxamine 5'-phosphate oxidase [Chloroflexales bacterium]|nr:pyridoxamine 5'-phosphate oxidase [Chloroflexales bacterium]